MTTGVRLKPVLNWNSSGKIYLTGISNNTLLKQLNLFAAWTVNCRKILQNTFKMH